MSLTSLADGANSRRYVEICTAAYAEIGLDEVRAQTLNKNPAFAAGLRELITSCSMPLTVPRGARLHIVRVPVNSTLDWGEMLGDLPGTNKNSGFCVVGNQYPVQEGPIEEHEIILVNFGNTAPDGQYVLNWAKPFGIKPADPRKVFAIVKHKPQLYNELELEALAIISLSICFFSGVYWAPFMWLSDKERFGSLTSVDGSFNDDCWFAFVRE